MNDTQEVEEKKPWNERFHLPLNGEMSHKKMRRLLRGQRNGGNTKSIIKRNKILRGKPLEVFAGEKLAVGDRRSLRGKKRRDARKALRRKVENV